MPRPRRETAAERRRRLRTLHCGECRTAHPEHAEGCDPQRRRLVTAADLLREDHDASLHAAPDPDCPQCAAERRRPGAP